MMRRSIQRAYRTPVEVQREGFEALCRTLGVADAVRFIRQYDVGSGDYTAEKRKILRGVTAEEAFRESLRIRKGGAPRKRTGMAVRMRFPAQGK